MARPTLIDERDGPCELCAAHKDRKCDRCKGDIGTYENMGRSGFQSVQPSHYHQQGDKRHSFWAELCVDCYAKDRAENYPKEKKWQPPPERKPDLLEHLVDFGDAVLGVREAAKKMGKVTKKSKK